MSIECRSYTGLIRLLFLSTVRICRTSHRGQQGESGTLIRNKSTASGQVTERRRGELRTMIEEQDNKFRSENVSARNDP